MVTEEQRSHAHLPHCGKQDYNIDYNSINYIYFLKVLSRKAVNCLDSFSRSSDIAAVGWAGLGWVGQYLATRK